MELFHDKYFKLSVILIHKNSWYKPFSQESEGGFPVQ